MKISFFTPAPAPARGEDVAARQRLASAIEGDPELSAIAREAAALFPAGLGSITLLAGDTQYLVCRTGGALEQTERSVAFCGHLAYEGDWLSVPDAEQDERFAQNPLVTGPPGLRSYAGAAIRQDGELLGAVCALDQKPMAKPNEAQRAAMIALAERARRRIAALAAAGREAI
jgi:GAF domain-containing protein